MTNTPDLTNASPGDVYQGPDGRQWEVIANPRQLVSLREVLETYEFGFTDMWILDPQLGQHGLTKVDG